MFWIESKNKIIFKFELFLQIAGTDNSESKPSPNLFFMSQDTFLITLKL
jgi:hypothetical protein